ncbi:MAG: glutamine--tRNA ligase/YqeY domain fusion protein, partial [Bacillota bacterium]
MSKPEAELQSNFIQEVVNEDLRLGLNDGRVHTRFPPEPNGYIHIGHAKAILIDYGIAKANGGLFNLRFDDTNPVAEDQEFVDAILDDIRWLGADWEDRLFFASDYFDHMYDFAVQLIKDGKAYVDDLSIEEIRKYRGTLTQPGKESPYRNRPVEENLDLFQRMKNGEFPDGARVLRAKIDMSSGNINMRDPVIYRIRHAHHHRSGDKWCIYPMYDYAHPIEDALEHITHSLCSIEYTDHRPLYDWVLDNVKYQIDGVNQRPKQIEFARLNITHTVMSKRKLKKLVEGKYVSGWDDPRMPTIAGLRRRGYTSASIQDFLQRVGVARSNSTVDIALLEHCIREELNTTAPRVMAVLRPLRLVITNYPEDQVEWVDLENNPEDPAAGTRKVPLSRVIYIEQEDFMENPPKKFFRLTPGGEVRLKGAYIIKCEE